MEMILHVAKKLIKHCDCKEKFSLVALEHEISDHNDRLEGLETDHDFLEHMLHYLENGTEGLQFIQAIAYQLRELAGNLVLHGKL